MRIFYIPSQGAETGGEAFQTDHDASGATCGAAPLADGSSPGENFRTGRMGVPVEVFSYVAPIFSSSKRPRSSRRGARR